MATLQSKDHDRLPQLKKLGEAKSRPVAFIVEPRDEVYARLAGDLIEAGYRVVHHPDEHLSLIVIQYLGRFSDSANEFDAVADVPVGDLLGLRFNLVDVRLVGCGELPKLLLRFVDFAFGGSGREER